MVKVSVVVPVYNTEKYLRQCLDSLLAQTLKEIEVICVNDGSNDKSLDIINEYVNSDERFKLIDKENSGYGDSMNKGFEKAVGEYIGILESDDFIEPTMLERLYTNATKDDLDVCKCGFFYYYSEPKEQKTECCMPKKLVKLGPFCPVSDIKSEKELLSLFKIKPTIWSAIYKRDFIKENEICFTKTPGASFQDTAFNFKVWAVAKRVGLIKDCLINYRQDNEGSSVNSKSKAFFICKEYEEIERFLGESHRLEPIKNALKLDAYLWNYERLEQDIAEEFILSVSKELKRDMEKSCIKRLYSFSKWNQLCLIVNNPIKHHTKRQREKKIENNLTESERQGGKIKVLQASFKKNGVFKTVKLLTMKAGRILRKK